MFIPFQATLYYMYANLTDLEIPVCKKSDDVPMELSAFVDIDM